MSTNLATACGQHRRVTKNEKVKGEITDEHEMGRETEIGIQRIGDGDDGCFRVLGGN
jgi:hypothetical protein